MAKKKKETSFCDQVMIGLSVFSGLLALICVIPKVPYRYAQAYGGFHQRFALERQYSLWGSTDHLGTITSWMSMRSEACRKMQEMNTVNPLMGALGTFGASAAGTGGAAVGCQFWQICKEDVIQRCSQYSVIMAIGITGIIFNIIGAVALFMVPMMVNAEKEFTGKSKKKKKKFVEAVTMTLQTVAAGFVFPMLSYAMYMLSTDAMFHALAKRSAYPYGYAYAGAFMSGAGVFFTLVAVVIAGRRWSQAGEEKEGDEEGSEDEAGMAPAGTQQEFVDPASLMASPGMAPPGMGPPGI